MITLVLKQGVHRETVAEALREMGLQLRPAEAQAGLFWQIWMTADQQSATHYVEDSFANVRYLSVRGAAMESLAAKLRRALPIWERDELLQQALFLLLDGSESDRQRVAMEVACEMNEYDPASAGVLQTFVESKEPSIRRAGARAFRTLPWPILRPTAEELAADSDPEIAALGQAMLQRIQELYDDG